jgi:hypothetical protein
LESKPTFKIGDRCDVAEVCEGSLLGTFRAARRKVVACFLVCKFANTIATPNIHSGAVVQESQFTTKPGTKHVF